MSSSANSCRRVAHPRRRENSDDCSRSGASGRGIRHGIPVLVTIGGILLVIGVILGTTGRAVGGRKHYYCQRRGPRNGLARQAEEQERRNPRRSQGTRWQGYWRQEDGTRRQDRSDQEQPQAGRREGQGRL